MKAREALERLKVHCESLQESLDLSEKIRVRQKKLLQQLQLNQQAHQQQLLDRFAPPRLIDRETGRPAATATLATASAPARGTRKKIPATAMRNDGVRASVHEDTNSRHSSHQRLHHDDAFGDDDILDSLVNRSTADARGTSAPPRSGRSAGLSSKPQATNARPAYTYADFDSLLQKVHSPHPYTIRAQPAVFGSNRLSRPTSANTSTATNRRVRSKSQGPPTSRGSAGAAPHLSNVARSKRHTNHFLAPTQASLQRVQARRSEDQRRPFI